MIKELIKHYKLMTLIFSIYIFNICIQLIDFNLLTSNKDLIYDIKQAKGVIFVLFYSVCTFFVIKNMCDLYDNFISKKRLYIKPFVIKILFFTLLGGTTILFKFLNK